MGKSTARNASKVTISAISLLMIGTLSVPNVYASSYSMTKKQIYINNQLFSAPDGFAAQDPSSNKLTTYLPIWYIQQLLQKSFGIQQTWDGHNWKLTIPSSYFLKTFTPVKPSQDNSKRVVFLNNQAFECPSAIVTTDLSSGHPTTYFPMWYIEQVLHLIAIQDAWDGTNWSMSGTDLGQTGGTSGGTAGGTSGGTSSTANASASSGAANGVNATNAVNGTQSSKKTTAELASSKLQFQNAATDDSSWWTRASNGYYVVAQTENPIINSDPTAGSKILTVQPGDKLYLFAYSNTANVSKNETTWDVNSADANITPDGQNWKVGQFEAAGSVFVATKPGVYTVQADIGGAYSVPLVITAGLDSLNSGNSMETSADIQGIRPLPAGLNPVQTEDNGMGTSCTLYAPDGNWIPISGKTTIGLKFVTVLFGGNFINPVWSFNIPVQSDGSFSAEVKSPVSGQTSMDVYTNYINDLTRLGNGQNITDIPAHFSVQLPSTATTLPLTDLDLMPSAKMDFNLGSDFRTTAEILYENAPSMDSGIQAINNYVSDFLTYDKSEMQPNSYRFQDSITTLNSKTGICEDYAELEASMLRSIGIRAETVLGVVDSSTGNDPVNTSSDNHEWLQVWDGAKWIIADPTWSSNDESNTALVTNQFFTNTQSFQSTHATDSNEIGTTFAKLP